MAIASYDLANKKRDLSDLLNTIVADQPRFISNFRPVTNAFGTKHEWNEDLIGGRSITAASVSGMTVTVSAADAKKVVAGTQMTVAGDSALFEVQSVSGTSVVLTLKGANGSKTTAPKANDILKIVSTPIVEGSDHGEDTHHQGGSEWNATQIFRKEIILTGTAIAVNTYGNLDNNIARQTNFAMQELTRDLNRVALFGIRTEVTQGVNGQIGGLYYFGTQTGGLGVDAAGATLDSFVINDGAQAILGAGGNPTQILVSPGQARVLSQELKDKVQVLRADDRRGAYVAVIVNDINGQGMTIIADPDVPDTDAWVLDPLDFGLSALNCRSITDKDTTPSAFDGIRRTAIGELTLEFRNAKQRLCRISNLKASAAALASLKG
jgi:hypothetical protein